LCGEKTWEGEEVENAKQEDVGKRESSWKEWQLTANIGRRRLGGGGSWSSESELYLSDITMGSDSVFESENERACEGTSQGQGERRGVKRRHEGSDLE